MRKNNKGFTLIEIIAVVTILGILSVVVVPKIFSLITESREQIYVQDARRLISQAQYKMSSNSALIDKPSEGECILMSMNYLNSTDFQSPPHGGVYVLEASFVAIKNEGGTYKYAAMLIEKTKDGVYRGVKLTTEEELNSKNALKNVDSFPSNKVKYVDSESAAANGGQVINYNYINENLKDYETNQQWLSDGGNPIIGRYNYEKEVEVSSADTSVPKFSAKVISADSKNTESLQVNLLVSASDADSSTESLKVCSKVSRKSDDSYPTIGSSYCSSYGTGGSYSKYIDLTRSSNGSFSFKEQSTAYIYVLVYDGDNNTAKKKVEYYVHENEAPEIKKFTVSTSSGKINLPSAKIKLDVTDDIDSLSDLKVCIKQDYTGDTCSKYSPYSSIFGAGGVYSYTFKDSAGKNITRPDGSKHTIKVFVKDSLGMVSSAEAEYNIYKNAAPVIKTAELYPTVKIGNSNGYSVNLKIVVIDDLSNNNNIKIKIGDESEMTLASFYNHSNDGLYAYDFPNPTYDGRPRKLNIEVTDEYGLLCSTELVLNNIYTNRAAEIVLNGITSSSVVCPKCDTKNGGSYDVEVSFTIKDDLVPSDQLESEGFKFCINEDISECAHDDGSNFKTYTYNDAKYEFSPYDVLYSPGNLPKDLYIAVIDNYGSYSNINVKYNVYKNQAPTISGSWKINTTADSYDNRSFNVPKVSIDTSKLVIEDDFNNLKGTICYSIYDKNGMTISSEYCESKIDGDSDLSLDKFLSSISKEFTFTNRGVKISNLDGQKIVARLKIWDDYGLEVYSDEIQYVLHIDEKPVIVDVSLNGLVKKSEESKEGYNGNAVTAEFSVLDFNDTYSVCLTENDECAPEEFDDLNGTLSGSPSGANSLNTYSFKYQGTEHGWSTEYKDPNPTKTFHFFVKDSRGKIEEYDKELTYTVYTACSNDNLVGKLKDNSGSSDTTGEYDYYYVVEDGKELSTTACEAKCYKEYTDNFNVKREPIVVLNDKKFKYKKMLSFLDKYTNNYCKDDIVSVEELYCNHYSCFPDYSMENITDDNDNSDIDNNGNSDNDNSDNSDNSDNDNNDNNNDDLIYIGMKKYDYIPNGYEEYVNNDDNVGNENGETNGNDENIETVSDLEAPNAWMYNSDIMEDVPVESEACTFAVEEGKLLFCSDDSRCKTKEKYCSNQGKINCVQEEIFSSNADGHCSYYKLFNPKPCKKGETPEKNDCYNEGFRACSPDESPVTDNCLRTCDIGENPLSPNPRTDESDLPSDYEEKYCTPYEAFEVGDQFLSYNATNPKPCKGPTDKNCFNEARRPCRDGEDPDIHKCLKHCDPIIDDDGNVMHDENGNIIYETPEAGLCTLLPPIDDEEIINLKNQCITNVKNQYITCKSDFSSRCSNDMNTFCSTNRKDNSWEEIGCDIYDGVSVKGSDYANYFCDSTYMGGLCVKNDSKCGVCTEEEINNNKCDEKMAKNGCRRVCYRKVDCSTTMQSRPVSVVCHGSLRGYVNALKGEGMLFEYSVDICPEFFLNYSNKKYLGTNDFSNNMIKYVAFNQDEQTKYMGDSNG